MFGFIDTYNNTKNEAWSVSEFNEFKSQIPQKPVLIDCRLKSWKTLYKFKWNEPYLSRGLNLNRGSNSASVSRIWKHIFIQIQAKKWVMKENVPNLNKEDWVMSFYNKLWFFSSFIFRKPLIFQTINYVR